MVERGRNCESGKRRPKPAAAPVKISAPAFDGDANAFPFYFLPFASQLFYDGSLAHLPWMQEAPDPLSTVMWGTWVEINPKTAEKLAIRQGDLLEVASQHGKLRAPALVTPGIAPDVVAMPSRAGSRKFHALRDGTRRKSHFDSSADASSRDELTCLGRHAGKSFGCGTREASSLWRQSDRSSDGTSMSKEG